MELFVFVVIVIKYVIELFVVMEYLDMVVFVVCYNDEFLIIYCNVFWEFYFFLE